MLFKEKTWISRWCCGWCINGGVLALGQSIFRVIKVANYASKGLTIGKQGTYELVGEMTGTAHYGGLKSHGFLKRIFGTKISQLFKV